MELAFVKFALWLTAAKVGLFVFINSCLPLFLTDLVTLRQSQTCMKEFQDKQLLHYNNRQIQTLLFSATFSYLDVQTKLQ